MRIVNMRDLSFEDRKRARTVRCGPDCECDTPKTGISIGKFDSFGDPYPNAVGVTLDKHTGDWIVIEADEHSYHREAARYPAADVEVIRYLPNEIRGYAHTVIDDD